jgi:hypothetical protein
VEEREKPEQKPRQSFCSGSGFSLSSTLLVEERAGRGGLLNIAFAFKAILKLPPLPNPLLHKEQWRRGGQGVKKYFISIL